MTRALQEIEADLARVNREIDLEQDPGYRRCVRTPRPNPSRQTRTPRRIGTDPISGRCGRTALLRKGNRRRLGWLPCNCLHCDQCGPRLRRQRVDHFLAMINSSEARSNYDVEHGGGVWTGTIARTAWAAFRRKAARAKANYVRFDTPSGDYLVLTESFADDLHVDVEGWLTSAYAQLPDGGRVTSSRAWALARIDQPPSGWTLEGISNMPVEDVVQVATELGMYAGGGMLKRTDDPARWGAFIARIGLHLPDHHRWWSAAA